MKGLVLIGWCVVGVMSAAVNAQDKPSEEDDAKPDKFADVVEGATKRVGFFETYEKDEHLYLVVREDQLDSEFLFAKSIARGIGTHGVTGGLMLNIFEADLVVLERHADKVYLAQRPSRFIAEPGTPEAESLDLTFGSSVLESAAIKATRDDSAVVIDTYGWFVSDLAGVGQRLRSAVSTAPERPGRVTFDKTKSHLEYVKGFERNLNVQAKLTFDPGEPVTLAGVPDSRSIPVSVHYSFIALPEEPMTPREADDRVGYFMTVKKDFSNPDRSFFKRYINKWRLECGGPVDSDGLCDPKTPITYYVDRTVPEKYRQAMIDGVEAFRPAFEAAGFRDAIGAAVLPDSADAEDVRYATLRWNVSDQPGWGAIGPSTVDPRTGEVLDADVLFEADMLIGWQRTWWNVVDPAASLSAMLNASPVELEILQNGGEMATLGSELAAQGGLLRAHLTGKGLMRPGDPVPEEYIYETLKWVTMHEVGHTLGLRHNFRSSVDTPLDKLHDKAWAEERGVFSSVMEYPVVNIAGDSLDTGHYYNPGVGSYDRWAISYGYTPSAQKATELARLAAHPGHAYGTDEDAVGQGAIDPTVNIFDLGSDPLQWGRARAALVNDLWTRIPEITLADDEPYLEATIALQMLLAQYVNAVGLGVKYIGGQYQYRDHYSDPDGRPPFVPVEKARQREALEFIVESAFSENAFKIPQDVLQQLGAFRWTHWGIENNFNGRIDYPLREQVRAVQRVLLERITSPYV
ncbi:MAG TPA: zinc-dependent metalloprotease, partial [Rhodothermales bacterium]|nr:zinc-dependent metalloprotease [Rhodothermales bacterium]